MSKEMSLRDEVWLAHWARFAVDYLDNNFSLVDTNCTVSGKRVLFFWKPSLRVSSEHLPQFIADKVNLLTIQLNKIRVKERNAQLGGKLQYSGGEIIKWKMDLTVGETLTAANIYGLWHVIGPTVPIFELKSINSTTNSVVIGPISRRNG